MQVYIGNVISVGFNYAPEGFLPCDGRVVPIATYEALYTLIGTTYGGDGVTNFGLPNLLGRTPIHMGQGPGLSNYVLGQKAGNVAVTLTTANLPTHTHGTSQVHQGVNTAVGTASSPANNYLATAASTLGNPYTTAGDYAYQGATINVAGAGSSLPISILNPFQAVNYIIAVQGIYPPHS